MQRPCRVRSSRRRADAVTEIVLVRHGSTAWTGVRYCGKSDPPLSRSGRAEAARVAQQLGPGLAPDVRIVSSPARRARATAEAIVAAAGLDQGSIVLDDRWREADMGIAEGRTFGELVSIAPDLAAVLAAGQTAIDWPDGETTTSLAARVATAWRDLMTGARPTLVVTHAGPLLHARAVAGGRPPDASDVVPPGGIVRLELAVAGPLRATVLPSEA